MANYFNTFDARRVIPNITYNSKDISSDINSHLKSISYTDNMSGQADDLQITLEDSLAVWSSSWFPDKGATLDVTWNVKNWGSMSSGAQALHVGIFEIDEISCSFKPTEISIKGVSVPDDNTLRGTENTRSWEKVLLKKVAQDLAEKAQLELVYDTEDNPNLDRVEQTEESDLAFLLRLCKDHGLALKICNKQIVIFDEAKYEEAEPTITIIREGFTGAAAEGTAVISNIISSGFSTKVRDTYKSCHVKYQRSKKKELIEFTFEAPDKKEGKTLQVSQQVASIAEAEQLAKKKLREKNSEETTGRITTYGNLSLLSGTTINVLGYGHFDGKYIITRAQHTISSGGYICDIDIRRCLNGY